MSVADFHAKNYAYTDGAAISLTGDLTVGNDSKSYSIATVSTSSKVGYYSVIMTTVFAFADGDFQAGIDAGSKEVKAANISVTNTYDTYADALSAVASGGVKANLIGVGINIALAEAATTADAYITGSSGGKLTAETTPEGSTTAVRGNVTAQTTGTGKAAATFATAIFIVSGADIAINAVDRDDLGDGLEVVVAIQAESEIILIALLHELL